MKRLIFAAATLVLGMTFAPVAGAAVLSPSPEPTTGEAGTSMGYVELDTLAGGPKTESKATPLPPQEQNSNLGSDLSAPAGPAVVGQEVAPRAATGVIPQSPQVKPQGGAVSQINPNAPQAFVASPINSVPGAISFVFIMALCVGAGVGAALVISWITGKKINLGLNR